MCLFVVEHTDKANVSCVVRDSADVHKTHSSSSRPSSSQPVQPTAHRMVAEFELHNADGQLEVRQDESGRVFHPTKVAPLGLDI